MLSLRSFILAAIATLTGASQSAVLWQRETPLPGPTLGRLGEFQKDSQGNLFAFGEEGGTTVWKYGQDGALTFQSRVEGHRFKVSGNHFYALSSTAIRLYDGANGVALWNTPIQNGLDLKVDQAGDAYVSWLKSPGLRQWTKIDRTTGTQKWTIDGGEVGLISGPNFLFRTSGRLLLASKATGRPVKVIDFPAASLPGTLKIAPLSGGRAFLFHSSDPVQTGMSYSFGVNQQVSRLLLPIYDLLESPLEDGGVLAKSSGNTWLKVNGNFGISWAAGGVQQYGSDASAVYLWEVNSARLRALDLKSGQLRFAFSPIHEPGQSAVVLHADRIWAGGSDLDGRAYVQFFKGTDGSPAGEWRSEAEGNRTGVAEAASLTPEGDVVAAVRTGTDLSIIRIDSSGDLVWSCLIPRCLDLNWINAMKRLTYDVKVTPDGRTVSVYAADASYELDAQTGRLNHRGPGYQAFFGDLAYRTVRRGYVDWTSKFDRRTGREIWRIPRAGPIAVDEFGSVFVGQSKNKASTGEAIWVRNGAANALRIEGDRLIATGNDSTLDCVDTRTGSLLWTIPGNSYFNSAFRSMQIASFGSTLIFRPAGDDVARQVDMVSGAIQAWGMWGAGDLQSYDRVSYDGSRYATTRTPGFVGGAGTIVGHLDFGPNLILGDRVRGGFALGVSRQNHRLMIAHWN